MGDFDNIGDDYNKRNEKIIKIKKSFCIISLFLFLLIISSASTSNDYDVKKIETKTFTDSNITYSNFSCHTDTKFATITEYSHTCSFDVIDKKSNEKDFIDIEYSYCPKVGPCWGEEKIRLTNFKPGKTFHREFGFKDYLINRQSTTQANFNFIATRTVFV